MAGIAPSQFSRPFRKQAEEQARSILAKGGVHLMEGSGNGFFEARVPFFRRFHTAWVQVQADGPAGHGCTCPSIENTGEICEHVYTVLLLANAAAAEGNGEAEEAPIDVCFGLLPAASGPLRLQAFAFPPRQAATPLEIDGGTLDRIRGEPGRSLLLELLPHAGGRRNLIDGGGFADPAGPWELPWDVRAPWLRRAARAGLLHLRQGDSTRPLPVSLPPEEEPAILTLSFERPEGDGPCRLQVFLQRGSRRISLRGASILAADRQALVAAEGVLVSVEHHGAPEWLRFGAAGKSIPVAEERIPALLRELEGAGPLPAVALPGSPAVSPETGTPLPRMRIGRTGGELRADLDFLYGETPVRIEAGARLVRDGATGAQWIRNEAQEARWMRRAASTGGLLAEDGIPGRYLVADAPVEVAADLSQQGFRVEIDGRPVRRAAAPRVALRERRDWFELEGSVEFEGLQGIRVDEVLLALREGRPFLKLPDGSLGFVPEEVRRRLEDLKLLADPERGGAVPRSRALLFQELIASVSPGTPAAPDLAAALDALRHPVPLEPPPAFRGELRSYQKQGLGWLSALRRHRLGGCLADDMGLGKTVQVLALLGGCLPEDPRPALVVAPRSVVWNWEREAARFLPGVPVVSHGGAGRARSGDAFAPGALVLTTYGTLLRDRELFASLRLSAAILDEAQAIRNSRSQTATAAMALNADFRLALTGTPIENRATDLWSILEFANPGLLPGERRFAERAADGPGGGAGPLFAAIRPLVLRRTKQQAAPELPPKIEQVLFAPMEEEQARHYEGLRRRAAESLQGDASNSAPLHVLEALLRLRQSACHPALVDASLAEAPSGKLNLLLEELRQVAAAGSKALVFSQFPSFLRIANSALASEGIACSWLDGATVDREGAVRRFRQDPACSVFLISLKAGGTGLNLPEADYVFLTDPWWNPAAEAQAVDRAHRIGRTRTVFVYRLVSKDTVEEKVLSLQDEKRSLATRFLDAEAPGAAFTRDDLRALLA